MAMFDRLHPKMRGIGEIELVQPSIQIYMQVTYLAFWQNDIFYNILFALLKLLYTSTHPEIFIACHQIYL